MTILDEIQTSIRQHAEGAGSSVVGIGQRWGVGSGIVLAEGRVLTNAHNVRGDQVTVTFADGRTAEGSVAGQDIDGDLAVVEVDTGGASALAFTWPYPPTRRCGPEPTRSHAASQRRRRSLASPSPPVAWPGGCAAP